MKLICLMPVRNEDWCLPFTLRALMRWCDEVWVLCHACTDRSAEIVMDVMDENAGKVGMMHVDDSEWSEMAHRQLLLEKARVRGATHMAIVDADEVLTGNLIPAIRAMISVGAPGVVLQLPWLALPRRHDAYITAGVWGPGQQVSMAFTDAPAAHWTKHDGREFHHRNPMGVGRQFRAPLLAHQGGIMHLQFLDDRRLRAKQALYKMTEVLRWPAPCVLEGVYCKTPEHLADRLNAMYGRAVYESTEAASSAACPPEWWSAYEDINAHFPVYSQTKPTWQEIEVKRLVREHGLAKFRGLDLFGVA